ncbi:pilus assembly protein FimV [Alphaproteobacteria bacterium]|nr:pilus assembly protein FimV [Alphaproteobacteria bacterium]
MLVIPCLFSFAMNTAIAEPIVVLTYGARDNGAVEDAASSHPFRMDPDYSETHEVAQNETLGHIMNDYYGGSGMNMKFVELAIVQVNRHAFVRGNPNFLFAKKTIRLPSLNQIRALVTGGKPENSPSQGGSGRTNEIYFFGG